MTFGEKIALCRKQKKMSQNKLGTLSDISGDIVGKYERDEMKPSIETAKKLSNGLGVSLDYLVGDDDSFVADKKALQRLNTIEQLPDDERNQIYKVVDALIRDFKAKQAYS